MAKNKIGLQFSGFKELSEKLDKLGGDLKKTAEEALTESKKAVTNDLLKATTKSYYPAKGKYSQGDTRRSIDLSTKVEWTGMKGSIPVGFDFDKSGPVSIFLMYGTPRHKPNHPGTAQVKAMYDAIYGSKAQQKIKKTQEEIFQKAIAKRLGGG